MAERSSLDAEVVEDAFGGITAFEDCRHHQVRTANHIATGEDLRVAGLVLELALLRRYHAALAVGLDLEIAEPGSRAWAETEGDQHGFRRDDFLGARNRLRAATATGIRLAETSLDHFHTLNLVFTNDGDGLTVEEEFHPFFLGVFHFLARARHVFFVATIGAGYRLGALANRGTVAVHRGVAAAENDDALALHVDKIFRVLLETEVAVNVGDQEVQRVGNARQIGR